jgi:hypothetical protein
MHNDKYTLIKYNSIMLTINFQARSSGNVKENEHICGGFPALKNGHELNLKSYKYPRNEDVKKVGRPTDLKASF